MGRPFSAIQRCRQSTRAHQPQYYDNSRRASGSMSSLHSSSRRRHCGSAPFRHYFLWNDPVSCPPRTRMGFPARARSTLQILLSYHSHHQLDMSLLSSPHLILYEYDALATMMLTPGLSEPSQRPLARHEPVTALPLVVSASSSELHRCIVLHYSSFVRSCR